MEMRGFKNSREFGEYLRKLRNEAKITIRQLQDFSTVSNAYLSQLENGKKGFPSPKIIEKIYPYLNISYEELMSRAGYNVNRIDVQEKYINITNDKLHNLIVSLEESKLNEDEINFIISQAMETVQFLKNKRNS